MRIGYKNEESLKPNEYAHEVQRLLSKLVCLEEILVLYSSYGLHLVRL